ncbi:DMSO/TMAO reductase YedYZ molybdopterin-dependent catalytic subunit [Salinibacterium amurskyense]|uniref:DMSO/TMAO reductase YedYZ molybdopterin-dependent catalytic subunit n=1 Tax=Salinibacterium amurskyense TaxID=205941 RepID=A0A2M9D6H4_9MICO|nr:molybdopterin-dependent oxidoreductase [Salinibacterium amurskyense]PJJ81327.1 DMSO/TMAO reductase YedYZ molybdopterin-dependent catalytic subunit [Salinibacterium amurskyense]RLQ83334.1 oxidoreductase [Salinibacterium amurskyense]GHD80897.1 oxidoreductase [Salinibacterium amurskyense]
MTSATKTAPSAELSVKRIRTWSALLGVLSAAIVLAVAEFFAVFISPASSPVLAVGSLVIDLAPSWLKDLTIALFGTNDKIVLLLCVGLLVLVLAVAIGLVEYARPSWGVILLVFVGVIATIAVTTRAQATASWPMPTVLGVVAGVLVLRITMIRLRRWVNSAPVAPATTPAGTAAAARAASAQRSSATPNRVPAASRRDFLRIVGVASVGAVLVGVGARVVNASASVVDAVRTALKLPAPAIAAPAIPASASLDVPGISTLITPNSNFYRIDTALVVPNVDADEWRLRITGMVENEIEISFAELLELPLVETAATLSCVSNVVGGDLVGNAMWLGYPIRDLLAKAKPLAGADMVLSRSIDGFTASTPLEALQDDNRESILAVGMNGEPLPQQHGFPVRMVVPGLYGYVSATKWVVEMQVTRFADATAYWTERGWSAIGPVKTQSRIDVPSRGSSVQAGTVAVAGVAWAPNTGITGVEVRIDGGSWAAAELATAISADTWVQWVYPWEATSGEHSIEVRATDAGGTTQSGVPIPVVPDGAEGWHGITVQVS